jgi:flagellar hook-length control protein FliK
VPSNDAPPAIPAEMLAINPMPQPIVAQQPVPQQASLQQSAPRETANAPGGSVGSKVGKAAAQPASAQDAAQSAPGTGTADFARAVAARAESAGSESNPDGQPQPEAILATAASTNATAPILPQHAHSPNAVDTARVTAPAAPAAPAEPVVEARAGHLGHSLGVEIARKVELGEETLRIRLNPIELGRIEVTLAFDDKGSLQATVRTESAQAMDLLRQDTPDLARTLDQAGVRTDAQSFRFENRGGDGGGQQAQQQNPHSNRGQFASSDDDAGTAEPIYRPIRSDGQVDLLA